MDEMNTWVVGGSRVLSGSGVSAVRFLAVGLSASPPAVRFSVGCAAGADALFVSVLASLGRSGSVFCAGARPKSFGVPAGWSSVPFAGGAASVPWRARLVRRSAAAVASAASGLWVVCSPDSRGSLLAAAGLAARGGVVRFFCAGFSGAPAPLPGVPGFWEPVGEFPSCSAFAWLRGPGLF